VSADQSEAWERLHASYRADGIVLVLGSGVSVSSGLPKWDALLERLAADWAPDDRRLFKRLREHELSLPVIASILEERAGSREAFVERVRDALYREFDFKGTAIEGAARKSFRDDVRLRNTTLRAVAALCGKADGQVSFSPNRKIRAVISLNMDHLLQVYDGVHYGRRLLRTVESPSASANPEKISLYHIHGLLRFDRKAGQSTKEAAYGLVLTEQDYYDVYNNPLSVFNYTFMYFLREATCLFIGLSMQDENVRRLLHFSKKERLVGFEKEGRKDRLEERLLRHFAIIKQTGFESVDAAIEESLLPLGTTALWIEDYPEIPHRLEELYESNGDRWALVY
jgi:hypothetical protein